DGLARRDDAHRRDERIGRVDVGRAFEVLQLQPELALLADIQLRRDADQALVLVQANLKYVLDVPGVEFGHAPGAVHDRLVLRFAALALLLELDGPGVLREGRRSEQQKRGTGTTEPTGE